jgi:hypothetical protein
MIVVILLLILLASAAAVVFAAWQHWRQPEAMGRVHGGAPVGSGQSKQDTTDEKQALIDELKDYSDRVSDLEKLISVLLGLSAIYTIALGLSSWASVQMNLQQAKEWVQSQQTAVNELRSRTEKSTKEAEDKANELKALVTSYQTALAKSNLDVEEAIYYTRVISNVGASLALALQGQYRADLEGSAQNLLDLRSKDPTDFLVSFYLGRAYRVLHRFQKAADAMSAFIKAKESAGQQYDSEVGDAYYNRAFYQSLLWEQTKDTALQSAIVADVLECGRRDENLLKVMQKDADFTPVLQEDWFKLALAKAVAAAGGSGVP